MKGTRDRTLDLNFSGDYQTQAQKYTEELFGAKNVFKAGTISTVAEKTAFGFVKRYYAEAGIPVRDSEVDRLAQGCSGVKRTTGQHPGGIVVLPKGDEITNYTPVQHPADDVNSEFVTTHLIDIRIGCLVKLDILGHDDPTMIRLLEDMTGVDVRSIPLDEPKSCPCFKARKPWDSAGRRRELRPALLACRNSVPALSGGCFWIPCRRIFPIWYGSPASPTVLMFGLATPRIFEVRSGHDE